MCTPREPPVLSALQTCACTEAPAAAARGRSAIDRGGQTRQTGPVPPIRRLAPRVLVHEPGVRVDAVGAGAIALAQRPGPAFGDGSHPTTRLCAGAVDLLARQARAQAVLDVGTGTGILARIARARGAAFVAATDIDLAALTAARANAELDVGATPIEICEHSPDHWGPRFDLVVANILEGPLLALAPALAAALARGGALLLSGFTAPQVPTLRAAFVRGGLSFVSQASLAGWCLLHLRAAPPGPFTAGR